MDGHIRRPRLREQPREVIRTRRYSRSRPLFCLRDLRDYYLTVTQIPMTITEMFLWGIRGSFFWSYA